jgi:MoaA/NifB/PqqE/SkfB family radical SAM enzyme
MKYTIAIPEKRVEIVDVVYEVNAKNDIELEEILELVKDGNITDSFQYIETKPNRWGFEVEDIFYDDMTITQEATPCK